MRVIRNGNASLVKVSIKGLSMNKHLRLPIDMCPNFSLVSDLNIALKHVRSFNIGRAFHYCHRGMCQF